MSGVIMRSALAALAVCGVALAACADDHPPHAVQIDSRAVPLSTSDESKTTLGKLIHRGTLRLTSPYKGVGGLSGLIVSDDGARFLAITDESHWLTGALTYRDGKLASASGTQIGHFTAPDGSQLHGKDGDAEGLAGSIDGDVFVSFERDHRVWRYAFGKDGLGAKAVNVPVPPDLAKAPGNSGLEAVARLGDGRLLAMTEAFHDANGDIRGWVLAEGKDPVEVTLKRRAPFDLTDIRQLPNGDLLTLERRFSKIGGVGFQMRRIPAASLGAKAPMDGEVVADAGMSYVIDNMEGLSVRTTADGKTLVYLLSDDNFNAPLQQTLLMMFELKD
jgi:hypothetical protein